MDRLVRFYWFHLKTGYIVATLLIPLCLLLIVVVDVIRVAMLGIEPSMAFFFFQYKASWVINGVALSVILIAGVPAIIATWRVSCRGRSRITRILRHQTKTCSCIYIALSIIIAYCVILCNALEWLGGITYVEGEFRPAFSSFFLAIIERTPLFIWIIFTALFVVLGILNIFIDFSKKKWINLRAYKSRLKLIALSGQFAPLQSTHQLNFNLGRLAPLLKGIQNEWMSMLKKYQDFTPGSIKAAEYLETIWSDVKDLLRLFGVWEVPGKQIRLTTGTSRALEIALGEVSPGACVLLSP